MLGALLGVVLLQVGCSGWANTTNTNRRERPAQQRNFAGETDTDADTRRQDRMDAIRIWLDAYSRFRQRPTNAWFDPVSRSRDIWLASAGSARDLTSSNESSETRWPLMRVRSCSPLPLTTALALVSGGCSANDSALSGVFPNEGFGVEPEALETIKDTTLRNARPG